jgi:hypothetical protein
MIRKDYIPQDENNLSAWGANLQTQAVVTANSTAMGWGSSASQVAAAAGQIVAAVAAKEAGRQAFLAVNAAQDLIIANAEKVIRPLVAQGKKEPTATEAIQKLLGVWGAEVDFDPQTYKAELREAKAVGNSSLQIKFAKALGELDAANLYLRKAGQVEWKMVATMVRSPFIYHVTLTTPGTPESCEVRVRGVVGNDEIGQFSDAVAVLVN